MWRSAALYSAAGFLPVVDPVHGSPHDTSEAECWGRVHTRGEALVRDCATKNVG